MPVPTETFRNMRRLNIVFALTALILFLAVQGLVLRDYMRNWRLYQRDGRVWETAMVKEAQTLALSTKDLNDLEDLQQQIIDLQASLPHDRIAELEADLIEAQQRKTELDLPAATVKGQIGPVEQQLERAIVAHGEGSTQAQQIRQRLEKLRADYAQRAGRISEAEAEINRYSSQLKLEQQKLVETQKQITNLTRTRDGLAEKLADLQPEGAQWLAKQIRDAPLLDWLNPTEKVQQVVVPDVRTDLNFLTVETIDRCNTCHVNIDNPQFEENNLVMFVERQVAQYQRQEVANVAHPVVMVGFWENTLDTIGQPLAREREQARTQAVTAINELRDAAGMDPLASPSELEQEFARIQQMRGTESEPTLQQWYEPISYYVADLQAMLSAYMGKEEYDALRDLYRSELIALYNEYRAADGLAAVNDSPVLLGHPRMDLFAEVDSKHPMKSMGCTVCHEGSGQDTEFVHTAHTPRAIWVDSETGTPVPETLVVETGDYEQLKRDLLNTQKVVGDSHSEQASAQPSGAALTLAVAGGAQAQAPTAQGEAGHGESDGHGHGAHGSHGQGVSAHHDVNLADPHNPAPFAPKAEAHGNAAVYAAPGRDDPRLAVRQADYWSDQYGWHEIHFMHWEKPMHSMSFIESSCNKCHTEIFDLDESAPALYEGRQLFASLGCASCHAVADIQDDPDVRQVGPSLVHVKEKLSPEMAASWIWSPKSFRPSTQMPHFFMLENNSSPVDILRTRTEVAAMTYYLMNAEPNSGYYAQQGLEHPTYSPEPAPDLAAAAEGEEAEDGETDLDPSVDPALSVERGRVLFDTLGCMACHTNIDEQGQDWITSDLVERGYSEEEAGHRYKQMDYNARHWYAMQNLTDKMTNVGPELSGVGTKLTTGQSAEEAKQWLYTWLRDPSHYDDRTIMPSFRLTEREASDLADYLLSLERPDYEAQAFYQAQGDNVKLEPKQSKMLDELVNTLRAGATVEGESTEEKMLFLGEKMIGHYSCNGCHQINGFEGRPSVAPSLDDWGLKDPHKLDFGYFDHAFDEQREQPIEVWKTDHEGLAANAPSIDHDDYKPGDDGDAELEQVKVNWEHVDHDRRGWLYHKLHNPRIYDRGKGTLSEAQQTMQTGIDLGRAFDGLKMPKFFLTDQQVRSLVTYVTSIRKPLVSREVQEQATSPAKQMMIEGRKIAGLYNCYGCHSIEGNDPHLWNFYEGAYKEDGSLDFSVLHNAPPRLVGQGAKTQPDWLFHFLHNVDEIRPWLNVRMPSFDYEEGHAAGLVDYFAGWSQVQASDMDQWLTQIEEFVATTDQKDWHLSASIAGQVAKLQAFAIRNQLTKASDFDPRTQTLASRREAFNRVLHQVRFLQKLWDIEHPYVETPRPDTQGEGFARGEALFNELRCVQCHSLGEQEKLIEIWNLDNSELPAEEEEAFDDGYGYGAESGGEEAYGYGDEAAAEEEAGYGYGEESTEDAGYGYGGDAGYGEAASAEPSGPSVSVEDAIDRETHQAMSAYTAPNLLDTAHRLQHRWVYHWVQEPAVIQPGTPMPQQFPGHPTIVQKSGRTPAEGEAPWSAFYQYPEAMKGKMEALYGYTGATQEHYLLQFIYGAGFANYTPQAQRLFGAEPKIIELEPLPEPERPAAAEGDEDAAEESPAAEAAQEADELKAVPTQQETVEPEVTSRTIELQEEPSAAWEGSRVVGEVKFAPGGPVRRRPIRMTADRYCDQYHKQAGDMPVDDTLVVTDDGNMQNVLVYVKSGLSGDFPVPERAAVLDQVGCAYHPHVLGMMAGQELKILNSDSTLHNVKTSPDKNNGFNEGMPVQGMVLSKRFDTPEMGITFRCDVHPWMNAKVHVLDNPFFFVSNDQGRFEILGLPPGTYTLGAVHERFGETEFQVTVEENTSTRADVTVTP